MAAASGRKVVVFGHQHGALDELWALKFWPDVARSVSDLVSLATPYNGTSSSEGLCGSEAGCAPATWQISRGSSFLAALGRPPLPRGPSYTSINSLTDALVTPEPEASRLTGASNVAIQDICPGRQVSHFEILADAIAYRLVVDALDHPGPADPARIPRNACGERLMPDSDPVVLSLANAFLPGFLARNKTAGVPKETASRAYTARKGPSLSILTRAARLGRRGMLPVRVRCTSVASTSCRLTVALRTAGRRRAGRKTIVVGPSRTTIVRIKVPRRVRVALRARRKSRLTVKVAATDALANHATLEGRVTARPVRRKASR